MVIFGLLTACYGLVTGVCGLLPQGPPPSFITGVGPQLSAVAGNAGGLSGWIPWGVAASVAAAVFGVWALLMVVAGVRWIVGLIPTMGG